MTVPRSPVAPVIMMFLPAKLMCLSSFSKFVRLHLVIPLTPWIKASVHRLRGLRYHGELSEINVTRIQFRNHSKKRFKVGSSHVGVQIVCRAPDLIDEPDPVVLNRLMQVISKIPGVTPAGFDKILQGL